MNRLRADLILLFVAVIWGSAFVAQKVGNAAMQPLWFVGVRFAISALVMAIPATVESRRAPAPLTRGTLGTAGLIGACIAIGACLQQVALVTASATNAGFLTALYVVLVPFTTWMLLRQSLRPIILLASFMAVGGAYLLGAHGELNSWSAGDTILVVSDVAWAIAISLISVFMTRANRPFFLAFLQFALTAVVAVAAALVMEGPLPDGIDAALPALLYTAVISGSIASSLQFVAQRHTPAPEAALIMSLESVFAAIAGAWWLGERLTLLAGAGCALILFAVIIAEVRLPRAS